MAEDGKGGGWSWARWLPRLPSIGALIMLAGALALRVWDPGPLEQARNLAFDGLQQIKPRTPPEGWPVMIVDIDEEALAKYGQWPWPRTRMAELVDQLGKAQVGAIAFDVTFAEPDRTSPSRVIKDWPVGEDEELKKKLATLPDHDVVLAAAIKRNPVVLGFLADQGIPYSKVRSGVGVSWAGARDVNPIYYLRDLGGVVPNRPELVAAASGNGAFMTGELSGGTVVRNVPLIFRSGEDVFASLAAEALRVAVGGKGYIARTTGASGDIGNVGKIGQFIVSFLADKFQTPGIYSLRIHRDIIVPTDGNGEMILYDSGHKQERYISATKIISGDFKAEDFEGKIVIIGTSAKGLLDLRSSPIEPIIPGVELHAQLVEQMLSGVYLQRPYWAGMIEWIYVLVLGLVLILTLGRFGPWAAGALAIAFSGTAMAGSWFSFSSGGWLVDPVFPTITILGIFFAHNFFSYLQSEAERRRVRDAFRLYLSPELVEEAASQPDALRLGGELRDLTVMFTDIRGFTTISEKLDPPGLARFLNGFLTPMTDIIMARRGTVDKYMGDAIMAFWNAPLRDSDHARNACRATLQMQADLKTLNEKWRQEAQAEQREPIVVRTGIGLNSGPASVGNFGSTARFAYSAMGDSVNLASRLEGQCKAYGVDIIIGENTRKSAPDFAAIELDLLRVKGKMQPERIYALVGEEEMAKSPAFEEFLRHHNAFLAAYRARDFEAAGAMIEECEKLAVAVGWISGYYAAMRERIAELKTDPPPEGWDGVHIAETK